MKKFLISIALLICSLFCLVAYQKEQQNIERNQEFDWSRNLNVEKNDSDDLGQFSKTIKDYKDYFEEMDGCAVFMNSKKQLYDVYNSNLANIEVSPCSTFKIVSTLIGLKNEVITDTQSKMGYSGAQYPVTKWNYDLSLQEAFQSSCVWYFHKIIDNVGIEEVKKELEYLDYGNVDISEWEGSNCNSLPELNGFWLQSSLKISPAEHTELIENIFEGNTMYTTYIPLLKEIMLVDNQENYKLYGKTGTGTDGLGWFSGMIETGEENTYFTVFLQKGSGNQAKEIAKKILIEKYVNQ